MPFQPRLMAPFGEPHGLESPNSLAASWGVNSLGHSEAVLVGSWCRRNSHLSVTCIEPTLSFRHPTNRGVSWPTEASRRAISMGPLVQRPGRQHQIELAPGNRDLEKCCHHRQCAETDNGDASRHSPWLGGCCGHRMGSHPPRRAVNPTAPTSVPSPSAADGVSSLGCGPISIPPTWRDEADFAVLRLGLASAETSGLSCCPSQNQTLTKSGLKTWTWTKPGSPGRCAPHALCARTIPPTPLRMHQEGAAAINRISLTPRRSPIYRNSPDEAHKRGAGNLGPESEGVARLARNLAEIGLPTGTPPIQPRRRIHRLWPKVPEPIHCARQTRPCARMLSAHRPRSVACQGADAPRRCLKWSHSDARRTGNPPSSNPRHTNDSNLSAHSATQLEPAKPHEQEPPQKPNFVMSTADPRRNRAP